MSRTKDRKGWLRKLVQVVNDPSTSDWLKDVLMEVVDREPLQATRDAEVVLKICQMRAAVQLGSKLSEGTGKSSGTSRRRGPVPRGAGTSDIVQNTDPNRE
jgi:hypothetical protein